METMTVLGRTVLIDDEHVERHGCGPTLPGMVCTKLYRTQEFKIVMNKTMTKQDIRLIEAAVAHEIGHIIHGDLSPKNCTRMGFELITEEEYLREELAADQYSAQHGYRKELAAFLKSIYLSILEKTGIAREDLWTRISALSPNEIRPETNKIKQLIDRFLEGWQKGWNAGISIFG